MLIWNLLLKEWYSKELQNTNFEESTFLFKKNIKGGLFEQMTKKVGEEGFVEMDLTVSHPSYLLKSLLSIRLNYFFIHVRGLTFCRLTQIALLPFGGIETSQKYYFYLLVSYFDCKLIYHTNLFLSIFWCFKVVRICKLIHLLK